MTLFRRMFFDHRRRWLGFAIGVAAVVFIYLPLYSSAVETDLLGAKLDALPDALVQALDFTDVASPEGYAQATVFGLTGMIVVLVFAIGTGAWSIAGDEESGELELTMAHGIDRADVLRQRATGLLAMTLLVAGVAGLTVWIVNVTAELGITLGGVLGATASLIGLALFFGAVSLLVGAVTGRRAVALAVTAALAFFGYISNTVLADTAVGGFFESISPFHWAYGHTPLVNGFGAGGLALLVGLAALLVAAADQAFDRRDVGV